MTEQDRPPLVEYAARSPRPRTSQPNSVAGATIVSGTALLLAPWVCLGLGNASWSSLIRSLHEWPVFWMTELLGIAMICIAYLRSSPFDVE